MANLSFVTGATDGPLIEDTIGRYFDEVCARHADREALVSRHQNIRLTYGELRAKADALACSFMRLGFA